MNAVLKALKAFCIQTVCTFYCACNTSNQVTHAEVIATGIAQVKLLISAWFTSCGNAYSTLIIRQVVLCSCGKEREKSVLWFSIWSLYTGKSRKYWKSRVVLNSNFSMCEDLLYSNVLGDVTHILPSVSEDIFNHLIMFCCLLFLCISVFFL